MVVAECRRSSIPRNINLIQWVLECYIMAHLNALRKAAYVVDQALKQSEDEVLLNATNGDLIAFGVGRRSSSGGGCKGTDRANRLDDVAVDSEAGVALCAKSAWSPAYYS